MLEVHVALSREMFGPDVVASVTDQRAAPAGGRASGSSSGCAPIRWTRTPRPRTPRRCAGCSRAASWRAGRCRPAPCSQPRHLAIKKPGTGLPPDAAATTSSAGGSLARSSADRRADGRRRRRPVRARRCSRTISERHSLARNEKICVVVTARPSYSRIRTALHAIHAAPRPRAAARRRGLGAARALRQRHAGDRTRRLRDRPRASTWCSRARTW